MRRPLAAGIVGTHWGLVHLRGLREAGCEVVALAARNTEAVRAVAEREGVPNWTTDIRSLNDLDVVVVATPAATHAAVLAQLPSPSIICEKPLLGLTGSPTDLARTDGRLYVNYAFPFLRTARRAADLLADRDPPDRVRLEVGVRLPQRFDPATWFLEAASHPLAWLMQVFGLPRVTERHSQDDRFTVVIDCAGVRVDASLRVGGEPGIHHSVRMIWDDAALEISGRYRPGQMWQYDPVLLDGEPANEGEWSATDCWLDANAASVAAMVAAFRGEADGSGLFDAERALWIERAVRIDL